jgi:hypothetical protein
VAGRVPGGAANELPIDTEDAGFDVLAGLGFVDVVRV